MTDYFVIRKNKEYGRLLRDLKGGPYTKNQGKALFSIYYKSLKEIKEFGRLLRDLKGGALHKKSGQGPVFYSWETIQKIRDMADYFVI